MYALKANFYPAQEPNAGYIGKADITIANAVRLNNISVFENPADGTRSIAFAKFGKDNERSYIIPSSKEAYAAALAVISKAVDSENHFAVEKGDFGVKLEVKGAKVNEPYADGRFTVTVGDFCTLNGISTREASYTKDGEKKEFVAVDIPPVRDAEGKVKQYTDHEGNQHVNLQYECLKDKYTNKEGKEVSTDYKALMNNMIRKCRKEMMNCLDASIDAANAQKSSAEQTNDAPVKEQGR